MAPFLPGASFHHLIFCLNNPAHRRGWGGQRSRARRSGWETSRQVIPTPSAASGAAALNEIARAP